MTANERHLKQLEFGEAKLFAFIADMRATPLTEVEISLVKTAYWTGVKNTLLLSESSAFPDGTAVSVPTADGSTAETTVTPKATDAALSASTNKT